MEELSEAVFSMLSVQKCYKHGKSRIWFVVGQSPGGNNMSAEAEDIVEADTRQPVNTEQTEN
jgi:hypothetical protein